MLSNFLGHKLRIEYEGDERTAIGKALAARGNALLVQIIEGQLLTTNVAHAVTFTGGNRLHMRAAVAGEMSGRVVMSPIGEITCEPVSADLSVITRVVTAKAKLHGEIIDLHVMGGGEDALFFESTTKLETLGALVIRIEGGGGSLDVQASLVSQFQENDTYSGVLKLNFKDRICPARWKAMCAA